MDVVTVHTCVQGHPGILADGCERCAEHAKKPMLLNLDQLKMEALWAKMLDVERGDGNYATGNEATAGNQLYVMAIWIERYLGWDPWRPWAELRAELSRSARAW